MIDASVVLIANVVLMANDGEDIVTTDPDDIARLAAISTSR